MNAQSLMKPTSQLIEVDKDMLAQVTWRLFQEGLGPMTADEVVKTVLARFANIAATSTDAQDAKVPTPTPEPQAPGYIWVSDGKRVTLPNSTRLKMYYKAFYYEAHVIDGNLMHQGTIMTPAEFARHIGGTGRNARHALSIKRPGDLDFIPARRVFDTEAVDVPVDALVLANPDILYRDVIADLDRLEALPFPHKLFQKIHHSGSTLLAFRRYVEQGASTGQDGSKCKRDSANGGNVLRIRYLLENSAGQATDEQWLPLVSAALLAHPRKTRRGA